MFESKVEAKPEAAAASTAPLPAQSDMANFSPPATTDPSLKSDGNSLTFGSAYANLSNDASSIKTGLGNLLTSGENEAVKADNELTNGITRAEIVAAPYLGRVENAVFNQPGNLSSVVEVEASIPPTAAGATHSVGTGFFVTPDSLVTADHVISSAQGPINIQLTDGQTVQAQVSKVDAADDLALLTVSNSNAQFPTLSLASDADASPTDYLYGHPYALPQTKFTGTFDKSMPLASLEAPGYFDPEDPGRNLNTNMDIFHLFAHPGASGGPILNSQGAVVSVADMGGTAYTLGIPAQDIQKLMS